jgi:hypothetical protein
MGVVTLVFNRWTGVFGTIAMSTAYSLNFRDFCDSLEVRKLGFMSNGRRADVGSIYLTNGQLAVIWLAKTMPSV